ncbi:MAG: type 1 glutamine amidotransferase [Actinomycetota bacterium]|nr:type 1 glutamine amidotransferase [Actinomycetota bacterium]
MRVLALVHHGVAGTGVFADEVTHRGHELEEWLPSARPIPRPLSQYDAVMAFGGGMQADQEDRYPWLRVARNTLRDALERSVPTLGVCLGAQVLARAAGGAIGPASRAESGWSAVHLTDAGIEDPLFAGRPRSFDVFQWHSYAFELPPGAVPLARNLVCLQSFRIGESAWGLQWHPEVTSDSVLLWGAEHPPAPSGVPVSVDLAALRAEVAARISATNDDGRALCARFLKAAEGGRRTAARRTPPPPGARR